MKSRKTLWIIRLVLGSAGLYAGWLAYCAHANLVTLDVRNMEVREVVKKMERQTWESISVDKGVQGKITLKVRRKPLEIVLRMIAEQTFSRPSVIYPLYSHDQSLAALQQALRGEIDPVTHGWTNLQNRFPGPFMFGPGAPGGGMFGIALPGTATSQKQLVSLNIIGKDIAFATLAFDRFARARVVPEDGTVGSVNLTLKEAPVSKAVARLAKNVQRKWTTLYALQGGFAPGGPQFAGGDRVFGRERGEPPLFVRDENGLRPRGPQRPEPGAEQREKFRQQREKLEEELKQALPFDERKKLEAAQQERQRQLEEFQNMNPEERAQRFSQMGGPNMGQMQRDRLLSSTPEQRAQMNRMRGQGPGGRGPGGPPR